MDIFFQEKDDLFKFKYKIRYYLNEEAKNLNNIKHPVVKSCLDYYNLKNILHITFDGDLPQDQDWVVVQILPQVLLILLIILKI